MNENLEKLKKTENKIFETDIKKSNCEALNHKITFRYVLYLNWREYENRLI